MTDSEEVEIAVMLARDGEGATVNVLFASPGALSLGAGWHHQPAAPGAHRLRQPRRFRPSSHHGSRRPDRGQAFEPDEIAALAEGRRPGSDELLVAPTVRRSLNVRLPGRQAEALEASLACALAETRVESAYLIETDAGDGPHLLLGLTGDPGAAATVDVPDRTDVVWLEEPLLSQVRAVADPFYRRGRQ